MTVPLYFRQQNKNIRKTLTTFVFVLIYFFVSFFILTHYVFAAEVQLSPSTGTYSNGKTFTVTIAADPQGQSVNAVEADFTFDISKLSVVSVSKTGSVFSLWTTEPTFSNTAGTITFGGGSPTPFSSRSTLATVTFRAKAEGTAKVTVASASALAADGLGTDVYSGAIDATYTISGASEPDPVTPTPATESTPKTTSEGSEAAITFGEPPRTPEVGSAVFLDSEIWYATKKGTFIWDLPFDVDTVALDIATSSEFQPVTLFDPPNEEYELTEENLGEGVQYFTIQFKNQVGWGAILHRQLKIDTVPPEDFIIDVRAGNSRTSFPLLTFDAVDKTSGIEHYEMTISDGEVIQITPGEAEIGYLLGELKDGTYTIKVSAYDFAGNSTESVVPVLITAGWLPPLTVEEVTSVWDFFSGKNLTIILLLLVIIGEFVYIIFERKRRDKKEQKLRKETREVQDQMEKIFSALRDEIYEQINSITKRPRLSRKEKEAVEGLNQALEVSETLIEKEITDVKKILK